MMEEVNRHRRLFRPVDAAAAAAAAAVLTASGMGRATHHAKHDVVAEKANDTQATWSVFQSAVRPLTHAAETGSINSTADSGASF